MDAYERIAGAFHRRIDSIAGAVDAMAPGIEAASRSIIGAALEDRKILVVAGGCDVPFAHYLVQMLRCPGDALPALPALALTCENPGDEHARLWTDLRTLSRDGDVLLCLDSATGAPLARYCAQTGAQRNLVAISLSEAVEERGPGICIDLRDVDDNLRRELLLMACHCLREQLAQQLLGG